MKNKNLNRLSKAMAFGYMLGFREAQERDNGACIENSKRNLEIANFASKDPRYYEGFRGKIKHIL